MTASPLSYALNIKPYGERGAMWSLTAPDGRMVGSWRTARNGRGLWWEGREGDYHQIKGADAFEVYGPSHAREKLRRFAVAHAKGDACELVAGRGNHATASDAVMYGDHPVSITIT